MRSSTAELPRAKDISSEATGLSSVAGKSLKQFESVREEVNRVGDQFVAHLLANSLICRLNAIADIYHTTQFHNFGSVFVIIMG